MKYNIALLRGDGIGPEIVDSAVEVLKKLLTSKTKMFAIEGRSFILVLFYPFVCKRVVFYFRRH